MEFYHVLNRGVDKRPVVMDEEDRVRFIHDLFVFNDKEATLNYILPGRKLDHPRTLLVHVHAFCLMPNHYHLLLSPAVEQGIPLFMKKLNMGYTKYFNEKHQRSGALWQGKYKKILMKRDAHFLYIPYYIHLNPLDLTHPQWREGKVRNSADALKALRAYRWSSHCDYAGIKNFPSVTERELLAEIIGTRERYEKEIRTIVCNPEIAALSLSLEN